MAIRLTNDGFLPIATVLGLRFAATKAAIFDAGSLSVAGGLANCKTPSAIIFISEQQLKAKHQILAVISPEKIGPERTLLGLDVLEPVLGPTRITL